MADWVSWLRKNRLILPRDKAYGPKKLALSVDLDALLDLAKKKGF